MIKKNNSSQKKQSGREQIKLLRRRRYDKADSRNLWPTREKRLYLKRFFLREKKLTFLVLVFLAIQAVLEIILIFVSHRYLQNGFSFFRLLLIVIIGVSLYLIASYVAIRSEKTLLVRLINSLRLKWFKIFIARRPGVGNLEDKSTLIAKISYHLPLLSSGLANSLVGFIRALILILIFFSICLIFGLKFFWFFALAVLASLVVGLAGFFIARTFIVQEATFYSKILKLMDFSLSDWQFTKFFRRERMAISDFNNLVDLDSYFRVRRDLWLRFSAAFVFALLIFVSLGFNVSTNPIGRFFSTANLDVKFILAIFVIYFSRLLYESLHTGLYLVPLAFGLSLSVPEENPRPLNVGRNFSAADLIFQSSKIKFFRQAPYHKNLRFCFNKGGRYLVSGARRTGKTSLARLFTGQASYGRRAWVIKSAKERFFYNDFFDTYSGFYHLDPGFMSSRMILEVALGREKQRITDDDFLRLTARVNAEPLLRGIFFEREDWRLKANHFLVNAKNTLLLQILYCLEVKPALIMIDNYWLDLGDPEIEELLALLARSLPSSIIIYFATGQREAGNYTAHYEI